MAPNSKAPSTTAKGNKCLCPVCDIADQWGIKYSRERCDKGKVVVPYLPALALNPDGTVCELPTLDPCEAIDKGFKSNNLNSGHVLIPKWIYDCKPEVLTGSLAESDAWPKKDNGDPKPFFKVFCLPDGTMIAPRDFVEPAAAGAANGRKWRPLLVNSDCKAGVWMSDGACGAKLFSGVDAAMVNEDVASTGVGDEVFLTSEPGTPGCVEYENTSNCVQSVEFQSSQTMTVEIEPGAFLQAGIKIRGGDFTGSSSTPGYFNKTSEPVCMTFTALHNNCTWPQPGQKLKYQFEPFVRFQSAEGTGGRVISLQRSARVCYEDL